MSAMPKGSAPLPAQERPPVISLGVVGWLRKNLFATWIQGLITLVTTWLFYKALAGLLAWGTTSAQWVVVTANLKLFMVGRYPADQLWRIWAIVALISLLSGLSWAIWGRPRPMGAAGVMSVAVLLALGPVNLDTRIWWVVCGLLVLAGVVLVRLLPRLRRWIMGLWVAVPPLVILMVMGLPNSTILPYQGTSVWNGLLLTIMLALVGIVLSFPLGVLLALGRRSSLPAVRFVSITYIEVVRGVPLISILFMGAYVIPIFLPPHIRPDLVLRAMVAITLFSAAYLAENVRGGLQVVPVGQVEAAKALGLAGWQTILFIVLPQAIRNVIPAIVGQFIGLLKDTSLVAIISLVDLIGIGQSIIANPDPRFLNKHFEVFVFAAGVYFVFSYSLSYASRRLEKSLGVGER